ncbi:MAG: sigma-70 family RNA polymerase sigma factor [Reichenbachiella sp.]|uniref:RNA polymerase sigma factor n=2 Tax=Reichenbachiella sp. TaxID=2184521 RepID=UPI00326675D3
MAEHLFRTEYGKLIAAIVRIFGATHIQLAEDMVQETMISAISHWSVDGVSDNPGGWLMQVARRKVLNELKRDKMRQRHDWEQATLQYSEQDVSDVFLEGEIEDNQLRMIFTCCHPNLNVEAQIVLTLKTLCGFGVKEVANALLTTESTINKRLYRAKKSIRESNASFDIPQGIALKSRLETVCLTLYLLFNEGYNSSTSDTIIQKDLCLEAIRLTKLLVDRFEENKKVCALLSLMCFHTARFDARIDNKGAIVLFEDQDRKAWNKELIAVGMQYLKRSIHDKELSAYHIEANIAAEHCMAANFEATNWQHIHDLYTLLAKFKPNAIIQLNLAIINSQLEGIESSLEMLDQLKGHSELRNYHLLPATQGIFCMKLGRYEQAISYLESAQALNPSPTESNFILDKIIACKALLSAL